MTRRSLARVRGALLGLVAVPAVAVSALMAGWLASILGVGVGGIVDLSTAARVGRLLGEVALIPGAGFGLWVLAQLIDGPRPIPRLLGVLGLAVVAALGTLFSPLGADAAHLRSLSAFGAYVGVAALAGAALLAPEPGSCTSGVSPGSRDRGQGSA